jgi:hypothetical protein
MDKRLLGNRGYSLSLKIVIYRQEPGQLSQYGGWVTAFDPQQGKTLFSSS